ncbi:hypothetical protein [Burkholderia pseudomallei]|uniref:hypothetical protein n=1 Tax=Burkholderia pseudomallei TaxID=28450 RepID=UPI0012AECE5A
MNLPFWHAAVDRCGTRGARRRARRARRRERRMRRGRPPVRRPARANRAGFRRRARRETIRGARRMEFGQSKCLAKSDDFAMASNFCNCPKNQINEINMSDSMIRDAGGESIQLIEINEKICLLDFLGRLPIC